MLGNGRLEAFCFDGVNRLCHIRGKLRKRVWIGVGDIVLLGLRDFQDQKYAWVDAMSMQPARSAAALSRAYHHLPAGRTLSSNMMVMRRAALRPTGSFPILCRSTQAPRCSRARSLVTITLTSTRTPPTGTTTMILTTFKEQRHGRMRELGFVALRHLPFAHRLDFGLNLDTTDGEGKRVCNRARSVTSSGSVARQRRQCRYRTVSNIYGLGDG